MDDIWSRIDDDPKMPVRYDENDCPMEWGAAPEDEVPFEIPRD